MEINPMHDIYIGELNAADPRREPDQLTAYQYDTPNSVVFDLVHSQGPWYPEANNCHPTIVYKDLNSKGFQGWYDTMPDGTPAYEIDGNRVRVQLIPNMTQEVGSVLVFVTFMGHDLAYTSTPLCLLRVAESAHGSAGEAKPEPIITVRSMTPEELEDPETKAFMAGIKAKYEALGYKWVSLSEFAKGASDNAD